MLWLLPFACSGIICWLNRQHIAAALAPPQRPAQQQLFLPPAYGSSAMQLAPPQQYLALPYATGTGQVPVQPPMQVGMPIPEGTYVPSPFAPPDAYGTYDASAPQQPAPPSAAMAQQPIAVLVCAVDGCPIRPEPTAWDDASMGRMPGSFTAPRDYPVSVLSYGPIGWANVLVNHPDDGPVEGWIETKYLAAAPTPTAAAPMPSAATGAINPAKTAVKNDAMLRHAKFVRSQGGVRQMAPMKRRPKAKRAA